MNFIQDDDLLHKENRQKVSISIMYVMPFGLYSFDIILCFVVSRDLDCSKHTKTLTAIKRSSRLTIHSPMMLLSALNAHYCNQFSSLQSVLSRRTFGLLGGLTIRALASVSGPRENWF